jgi:adenylate cyclase
VSDARTVAGEAATRPQHARPVLAHGQLPFVLRTVAGLAVVGVGANVIGAVIISLLVFALNAHATHHQALVLVWTAVAAVAVSTVAGTTAAAIVQRRTLRWVLTGREPDEAAARRAVRLPLDMALIAAVIWTLDSAAVGIVAVSVGTRAGLVFGICAGVLLSGLCSSGVTYLLIARVAGPVTRLALRSYPPGGAPFVSVRSRLMLVWLLTTGVPVLGILMILLAPHGRTHIRGASIVTACVALGVGAISTALAARWIGKPLRALVAALGAVGDGQLGAHVAVGDAGEIGLLQKGFNDMVAGLRERERVTDLFGRHVGPAVAAEALRSGVTLSGEEREVVALFVDITGSTALTRTSEPAAFVAMLNRFFEIVVAAVERNGGLVNKFEGDAALCVFGAPVALADAAGSALRSARQIRDRVTDLGEVDIGIGVAAGPVVAGQIGARSRLEYTVVGDAVNEAARLTDLAKAVAGRVLASGPTVAASGDRERVLWRTAGESVLRGRASATQLWTA